MTGLLLCTAITVAVVATLLALAMFWPARTDNYPCTAKKFTTAMEAYEHIDRTERELDEYQFLDETPSLYLCENGHWHTSIVIKDYRSLPPM